MNPVFNSLFVTYKFQVICVGTPAFYLRDPRFDSGNSTGLGFYLSLFFLFVHPRCAEGIIVSIHA